MDPTAGPTTAHDLLDRLQSAIADRDLARLLELFADDALLVGTGGRARGRAELADYLAAVVDAPAALRWDWDEVLVGHEGADTLGFAGFGDIVLIENGAESRSPFRLTVLALAGPAGWQVQQFHGSIPSDF